MEKTIIGAVIAKTQEELDGIVDKLKHYTEWMQLDVMDGAFVPNTSLEFDFSLPTCENYFEAQLMVRDPADWISKNAAKFDALLVHVECCINPWEIIELGKTLCKKVGLALNPGTPVEAIAPCIDEVDEVLVMAVVPGAYGGAFIPETLDKVRTLRELRLDLDIEVDGGITDKTITLADAAGANLFVLGSYLLKSDNVGEAVNQLKKAIGVI
jgi:ribulose-phosphate 3-epimerase